MIKFLIGLTFLLLVSCSDSTLPKYVELNDLRVLTLIADKPEVNPAATVVITPVVSDINETTSLTYEAFGCVDPGVSAGADPSCASNPTKVTLAQGTITAATSTEMAQNFTGSAPSFNVVIPSESVIFSQRSDSEKFNGVSYLVDYRISNSRGQSLSSVKRLAVSNKASGQQNINPVVTQLLSNGTTLGNNDFPLNGVFSVNTIFDATSFQTYTLQKDDGSTESSSEQLTTTWFITDGTLKFFRTTNQDLNEYTAPATLAAGRKSFLISVSRDARGGTAVKRICGGC